MAAVVRIPALFPVVFFGTIIEIRQACSSQILYLSNSTKITTNTETAMLSTWNVRLQNIAFCYSLPLNMAYHCIPHSCGFRPRVVQVRIKSGFPATCAILHMAHHRTPHSCEIGPCVVQVKWAIEQESLQCDLSSHTPSTRIQCIHIWQSIWSLKHSDAGVSEFGYNPLSLWSKYSYMS